MQMPGVDTGVKNEVPVLDFTAGVTVPRWYSQDDRVMGGISRSSFQWQSDSKAAVFQGERVYV